MLQTERPVAGNGIGSNSNINNRGNNRFVKFGKEVNNDIKWDIIDLLLIVPTPEEFDFRADIKYLYYKKGKVVGIMAYNLVPMGHIPTPLCIHIIGEPAFRKTREAYDFMMDTFRDLKKEHQVICTHIPNDRQYIIQPMLKFGFIEYTKDSYGKFYYLDLEKIQ